MKSRVSDADLVEMFSLGNLFISDFVKNQPNENYKSELKLMYCPVSKLVQLEVGVDPKKMYGQYWYRSGTNSTMKKQLSDVVESCLYVTPKLKEGIWLDIACNDGTLLSYVPDNFKKIGIDPCDDSYIKESRWVADEIIQDFFSHEVYQKSKYANYKCDIITCIAMFYDLEDPFQFLEDVRKVLNDDGLFVIQMSYTPLMVKQLAFDNICHEHLMYYSLYSLKYVLEKSGFVVVDCELNDVNGGSFRVYIQKDVANPDSYANAPYRDVSAMRVQSILEMENNNGYNELDYYLNFFNKIKELKEKTVSFIKEKKEEKKTVWAYGASTKGNTLLQYFDLNNTLIDYAVERSPYKFGLHTVGSNIEIVSEEFMRKNPPDYLLILPWHFVNEFVCREKDYLENGGSFIVPCPKFTVLKGE